MYIFIYKMKVYTTFRFLKSFLFFFFLLNLAKFRDIKKFFGWVVLKGQLFYPILYSFRILFLKVCITSKTVFLVLCNPKIVTQSCLILCNPMDCISSVQFSSVTQSCLTLCDPMNRSTPGLPVHHKLPEFTQTQVHRVSDAIQPSHRLSSPSPPAPKPSQHQGLFQWVNSLHEVAKILEFQLQRQSFQWTPRTDLL